MKTSLDESVGMCGKMGKVINLFLCNRTTLNKNYEKEAERLLDEIWNTPDWMSDFSYGYGFSGLGCGVEFLIQNKFVEGEADKILIEIDYLIFNIINERPNIPIDIKRGLLGLVCYFFHRLHYREKEENSITLNLKEYAIYLIDWIDDIFPFLKKPSDLYELNFCLILLHQLNIYNYKIEHLLNLCNLKIFNLDK